VAVLPDVLIFYLPEVAEVLHPVANIQHDQCTEFFRDGGFVRIGAGGWRSPACMIFSNGFSVIMVSIRHQLTACNDDLQRTSCLLNFPDSVWQIQILQKPAEKSRWTGSHHPASAGRWVDRAPGTEGVSG